MRRVGGSLKPWSAVVQALERGLIPFWIVGDKLTTKSLHVRPDDIAPFEKVAAGDPPVGLQPADTINQLDAAEVLNISALALSRLGNALDISFKPKARALVASSEAVLSVARRVAWSAEISWHLRVGPSQVDDVLLARRVKAFTTGWCRRTLIEEGVLPPLKEL